MSFNKNIPQPTDRLAKSQQDLLANNLQLNTSFGINHYPFDDISSNNGFHTHITTPLIPGSAHPITTTTTEFYAMQDSVNTGLLQYSRGPNNAVPSPVTCLQSPSSSINLAPGGSTNVLDFTGITGVVLATLYASNIGAQQTRLETFVRWRSTGGPFLQTTDIIIPADILSSQVSGTILQIKNNSGSQNLANVFWTLRIHRMGA